jgi:nucleoside-diphosphate-sugar epimerase
MNLLVLCLIAASLLFDSQHVALAFSPPFQSRTAMRGGRNKHTLPVEASSSLLAFTGPEKPVLVVGATGRVGRRVVQKLIGRNKPVRALVRNPQKAQELFGTSTSLQYPKLEIIIADMSRPEDYAQVLDDAVKGTDAIISVMGAVRFAQLSDFLPWRLFGGYDVNSWADRSHPYYGNYLGQKKLIELAEKYKVQRFVRLTGLGLAYSAFNPLTILFNSLLSITNRYGILCEQALASSKVPYVVLRPGGLISDGRDYELANLQLDASGKLPYPGRIGRSDVADLAVEALLLPSSKSLTLACRWCGEGIRPKSQGSKSDGVPTAKEGLARLVSANTMPLAPPVMKPYALAVGLAVYSFCLILFKSMSALLRVAIRIFWGS